MGLSFSEIVTYTFVIYIMFYAIGKVASFYSVSSDSYIPYFMFYLFIIFCINIVQKD